MDCKKGTWLKSICLHWKINRPNLLFWNGVQLPSSSRLCKSVIYWSKKLWKQRCCMQLWNSERPLQRGSAHQWHPYFKQLCYSLHHMIASCCAAGKLRLFPFILWSLWRETQIELVFNYNFLPFGSSCLSYYRFLAMWYTLVSCPYVKFE